MRGVVGDPLQPPRRWSPEKFKGVMLFNPAEKRRITPPELLDRLRKRFYDKDLPSPSTVYRWMDKEHDGPVSFLIVDIALALGVDVTAITDPVRIRSKSSKGKESPEDTSGTQQGSHPKQAS